MSSTLLLRLSSLVMLVVNLALLQVEGAQYELQSLESQQEVHCRTGRELAFAIANPKVREAVLLGDITLGDGDFAALNSSQPISVQRNLTIRGLETGWPLVLDMNYLRAKLVFKGHIMVVLQNLFLVNCRRGSATQQPGFDILTVEPDTDGRVATVQMRNCYIVYKLCFPESVARTAFNIDRPAEVPGKTTYILPYPSPYTCTNYRPPPATVDASLAGEALRPLGSGNSTGPWTRYGCFKHVVLYADVAVYGGDMKDDLTPDYGFKYPLHALNTQALCIDILSNKCIEKYGYIGCLTYTINAQAAPPPPPLIQQLHLPVPAATLGSIIGGIGLLTLAAAVTVIVVLLRRRRRQCDTAKAMDLPSSPCGYGCGDMKRSAESARESLSVDDLGSKFLEGSYPYLGLEFCAATAAAAAGPLAAAVNVRQQECSKISAAAAVPAAAPSAAAEPTAAFLVADDGDANGVAAAAPPGGYGGGSGGGGGRSQRSLCMGSTSSLGQAMAAEDVTLLPVTPLTPLHPGINLDVRLGNGTEEVQVSGATLGKGAFGRVVAGVYGGLHVAVKIMDHGLLGQWRPVAVAAAAAVAVHHAGHNCDGNPGNCCERVVALLDRGLQVGSGAVAAAATAAAKDARTGPPEPSPVEGDHPELAAMLGAREAAGAALPPSPGRTKEEMLLPSGFCGGPDGGGYGDDGGGDGGRNSAAQRDFMHPEGRQCLSVGMPPPAFLAALRSLGARKGVGADGVHNPGHKTSDGDGSSGGGRYVDGEDCSAAASMPSAAGAAHDISSAIRSAISHGSGPSPSSPVAAATAPGGAVGVLAVRQCIPAVMDAAASIAGVAVSVVVASSSLISAVSFEVPTTGGSNGGGTTQTGNGGVTLPPPPLPQARQEEPAAAPAAVADFVAGVPPDPLPPPPSLQLAPGLERALKQEVEILARCHHPNVVRLLAACLRPPTYCLVMERMEMSLDRMLYDSASRKPKLLPLHVVLTIAIQIAQGLTYLHPTIIHRDLKPGNVLISHSKTQTGRLTVKIADFGLSRLRDTVLITRNPEVGTAQYIAPEAFDVSNNRITDRVDVYALGIMMWEMLAGSRPWAGLNIVVIALSVAIYRRRPPLEAVSRDRCPPKLRLLIESCWEQIPERRPAAAEVAKRLVLIQQQVSMSQS